MKEEQLDGVLVWIRQFQNIELKKDRALADIGASSARVSGLSEYIVDKLAFGSEPAGFLTELDKTDGGDERDEN